MLSAAVMFWIVRHGEARVLGVFPDRDKMTIGYSSIFNDLTAINFSSLCRAASQGIRQRRQDAVSAAASRHPGQLLRLLAGRGSSSTAQRRFSVTV